MVLTLGVYMSASTLAGDLDFVMYDCRLAGTPAIALFFVPAACCCLMVGFVCFLCVVVRLMAAAIDEQLCVRGFCALRPGGR